MKRLSFVLLILLPVFSVHAQNKGFYLDIGDGWFFDVSDGFASGALAPVVVTATYFTGMGFGPTAAYGYYAFGQKNSPLHSHSLFLGADYSIPSQEGSAFKGFPATTSFAGGLYMQFSDKTAYAPTLAWETFIFGRGQLFSHFYLVNRFTLYYFLDNPGIGRGGPLFLAWSISSGFTL
jgi:hypothetical protein